MTTQIEKMDQLDEEWVQLILEALEMGIDKGEIRTFLKQHKVENY